MSWWPGDGNATDIVGGNDGTLQGGATFVPGLVGQAFSFDGVDDYVLVPDAANLDLTSGITIETWINPAAVQDDGAGIVAKGAGTQEAYGLDIVGNICPRFFFRDASLSAFQQGPGCVLTPGIWTHVAATYDAATGAMKFYVNGVELGSPFNSAPPNTLIRTNDHELSIGSRQSGSAAYDLNFSGLIDEVEIYNRALTAEEIAAIFNAGSAGKCKVTTVAFQDFSPKVELDPAAGEFQVKATVTLGTGSNGIAPVTEIVQLELTGGTGSFATTIPAGSFEFRPAKLNKKGKLVRPLEFKFEGVIDGVVLEAKITDLGGGAFEFKAEAEGAALTGIANPVTVTLMIGDDGGSTIVEAEFE